jgi:hypothetical protein
VVHGNTLTAACLLKELSELVVDGDGDDDGNRDSDDDDDHDDVKNLTTTTSAAKASTTASVKRAASTIITTTKTTVKKEVFLTGATSKLGRAAALYLCRRGVKVLMLTSSVERFEAIAAEVEHDPKVKKKLRSE